MITSDSITEMYTLHQNLANLMFSTSEGLMQVRKKQLPFPSSTSMDIMCEVRLVSIKRSFC